MNRPMATALLRDAVAQVLDNKVFRLLVLLVVVLVLPTFLIGARPDRLIVLFGWREYRYDEILGLFDQAAGGAEPPHELLIGILQKIFVDVFAGFFGILVCLCATAFFVPRMLEKGAADTLFSKPVGRSALLFFRYVSGLLFVTLLAVLLVGGIHVGLLLNSGYSDPGFLWSVPVLVYLFAILHGVSTLAGVATRSSVAAILITFTFYLFNGCVHTGWTLKEHLQTKEIQEKLATLEATLDGVLERPSLDAPSALKRWLFGTADFLHYTLPKTGDASLIAEKVRRSWEQRHRAYFDPETGLVIGRGPAGFTRQDGHLDAAVEWLGPDKARILLRRVERVLIDPERPDRPRKLSTTALLSQYEKELSLPEDLPGVRNHDEEIAGQPASSLTWTEPVPQGSTGDEAYRKVVVLSRLNWAFFIEVRGPPEWASDESARKPLDDFLAGFSIEGQAEGSDPSTWYASQVGWSAPLPYNLFFSIGSSIAFTALMLALAAWLLWRMDF